MNKAILWIDASLLTYFLLLNTFYTILLILTIPVLTRRFKEIRSEDLNRLLTFDIVPPISIIMTAFNEEAVILESVRSALNVEFPHVEVIVVNDGSSDKTLQLLMDTFQLVPVPPAVPPELITEPVKSHYRSKLHPNLLVIDKERGEREDAVNAGINACLTPYFVGMDADSFIEPDTLHRLAQHLLTHKNICAMGGTLRLVNGCTIEKGHITDIKLPSSFFGKMQIIEYIRIFLFGRIGWNKLGGSYLISGGFGLYNKQAVLRAGGLKRVLAGDLDLTMRLHEKMHDDKQPYTIDYVHDAVVWTDVPQTYSALANQRRRWHSSIIDICWRFRHMIFNIKYGPIGFIHIPYLFFGEGLGPLVEAFGYLYLIFCFFFDLLNIAFFWYFILIAWGFSMLLTFCSLIMEEVSLKKYFSGKSLLKLAFLTLIENFGYRQMTIWWRIQGSVRYFTKKRFWREKIERSLSIKK